MLKGMLDRLQQLCNDTIDGGSGSGALTIDDLITELGNEDNPLEGDEEVVMDSLGDSLKEDDKDDDEEDKEDKSGKKKDSKDDDDEEEPELTPEDLELLTLPKRQEILKAFPDLFKKFPSLEKMMYREKEYTEIFSSIDDAREAAGQIQQFEKFQSDLLDGNISSVYKSLRETDPEAFKTMVDGLIPNLQKVDPEAYNWVVTDVTKRVLYSTFTNAQNSKNEELQKAVQMVYRQWFGDAKLEFNPFGKAIAKGDDSAKAEKDQFYQERFDTAKDDLSGRVTNVLRSTINQYIDPKSAMTPYVKRNAVNDALKLVDRLIEQDTRFVKSRDGLWEKAAEAKFSQDSVNKIRSAWLSKARTLLPEVVRKVRAEALKSTVSKRDDSKKHRDVADKVDEQPKNRTQSNNSKSQVPKGMSSLDFLNAD